MGRQGQGSKDKLPAQHPAKNRLDEQAELLEFVQDAIIASDDHFRITYWNRAAEELYGWTQAEALGQNVVQLVRSEVSDSDREEMVRQTTQTGIFHGEVIHHAKDGRRLIIEGRTTVRKDGAGKVIGYVSANRDVTTRKQVETKNERLLRENLRQQSLLDAIFDADPSGLAVVTGPDLRFVYANPTYRFLCPEPGLDLIGQTYNQVWVGEEGEIYQENIRSTVECGRPFQATGFKCRFLGGSRRIFTLQVRRISWEEQPAALVILWDVTDRVEAEERLKFQANLLANISDVAFSTDKELRLTSWNHSAEKTYGWQEKDVLGRYVYDVIPNMPDLHGLEKATGQPEDQDQVMAEITYQGQSGELLYFESKTIPLRGDDGEITGYVCVSHDITQRKQAEHELRESEKYWRTIVDFTADWEYWVDPQGNMVYNSPSCEKITGRRPEEFYADPGLLVSIAHPDDQARIKSHFDTERTSSKDSSIDFRIRTPDGEVCWVDHVCQPVYTSDGQPLGRRVSNREITANKTAEEALRYQAVLLDHLSDAVIASDQHYRLTSWNKAAEALYGWKAEEVLGKNGLEIIQTQFPEADKQAMLASIAETGHYHGEAIQVRKDGTRFPVDVRSIVLRDQNGEISGYLSVNRDISDYKRDQENLLSGLARIEVQRRLLEQREQERQQIARDLHDGVIQELTGVSFILNELLTANHTPDLPEKLAEVTEMIQEQIGELRAYAGELRPPILAKFGLGKAIRAHVENYQERHPAIKIRFDEHQIGELLPEEVRVALFRIYQESLTNIAKHAQAAEIIIRLEKTETEAILEIQDNGRGFQVPGDWLNLARHGHLGLVGMRERAEASGGSLNLYSKPGSGTLVRVIVPLQYQPEQEPTP